MSFPWKVPHMNQSDVRTARRVTAASPVPRRRALGLRGHRPVGTQAAGRRTLSTEFPGMLGGVALVLALPQPGSTSPRVTGLLRLCGEQQQTWGWCGGDLAPATTWPLPQPAGTERTRGGSSRPVRRLPGSTRCSCLVLEFRRRPRARGPHPGRWLRSLRRYSRVARSRRGSEGVHEPTAS